MKKVYLYLTLVLASVLMASCGNEPEEPKPVMFTIAISPENAEIYNGENVKLKVKATPDTITLSDYTIVWESDNEMLATVDQKGNVTANTDGKSGFAKITARIDGRSDIPAATCNVYVKSRVYTSVVVTAFYVMDIPSSNNGAPWDEDGTNPDIYFRFAATGDFWQDTFENVCYDDCDITQGPGVSLGEGINYPMGTEFSVQVWDKDDTSSTYHDEEKNTLIGQVDFDLNDYKGQPTAEKTQGGLTVTLDLTWVE